MSSNDARCDVAPLPGWPIKGIEFTPSEHFSRVLSVLGCDRLCPYARAEEEYIGSAFSNFLDADGILQQPIPGVNAVFARDDFWARDAGGHTHEVDPDLVYPYVRIHHFPFPFSRMILVPCDRGRCLDAAHTPDEGAITGSKLYVADIHLRWSEIERGVYERTFVPDRYTVNGYPFNIQYFDLARELFHPRIPYTPQPPHASYPQLIHGPTNLPLELCPFGTLERRISRLARHFGPADGDGVPLLARMSTAWIEAELMRFHGRWWLHTEQAIFEFRYAWLPELFDAPFFRGSRILFP